MRKAIAKLAGLCAVLLALSVGCPHQPDSQSLTKKIRRVTAHSLRPFASKQEFDAYARRVKRVRNQQRGGLGLLFGCALAQDAAPMSAAKESAADESITNNQEQGVDEGDIVKALGDYFVILRRGRLFTVRQREHNQEVLRPVSRIDAYPEGFTQGTWYDEMLLHQNRVVVIGYSYQLGATEVGLFSVDEEGMLAHRGTFFVSSNDYYSSRNYASRLVEGKLILYMPYYMFGRSGWGGPEISIPHMRTWQSGDAVSRPRPVLAKTSIYRPVQPTSEPTLHTIVQCSVGGEKLHCNAEAVLGPYARTFYVSPEAVYVWVGPGYEDWDLDGDGRSRDPARRDAFVYRLPLDGSPAGVLKARGMPIDQFSFKEANGHLNVVVGAGYGDAMWGPEKQLGKLALLRVPLELFSDVPRGAPQHAYRPLPRPEGYTLHNRFVGRHLLYGAGNGWYDQRSEAREVFVTRVDVDDQVHPLELGHTVERIEVMGADAVVIGGDGEDLRFSAVGLRNDPFVAGGFVRPKALQGETRSHGFFFKPATEGGGTLGLPVRLQGQAYHHLYYGSAEVMFLRVDADRQFSELGALRAAAARQVEDDCRYSCVDWYGNARPIFYRGRIFALMGYELIEGGVEGDAMRELRRINYFSGEPGPLAMAGSF